MDQRFRSWMVVSLALLLGACGEAPMQPSAVAPALRLARAPLAVRTRDVDYLHVGGQTFHATIYEPEGRGPFPAILDIHGGNWTREDVRRDEHAVMDRRLAAMGLVVVAIDFRHSARHRYPDSVADVNFAMRWLRANAAKLDALPRPVGMLGSSTGGHLALLAGMRPSDPRYAALPLDAAAPGGASPDYMILAYPITDPIARRAYNLRSAAGRPVQGGFDIYFAAPGSAEEGDPQLILERREPVTLPPVLLLQGTADGNGPEMQRRFSASYQAAGGRIQLELVSGAVHNFVNTAGPNLDRALELMKAFIARQLGEPF